MALFWGWIFEAATPDLYDIMGAVIALVSVMIIFYMPRKKGEESIWSR
jgi:small multidrug resistance family-3 protein